MRNLGLYTDVAWSVEARFVNASGSPVDLSGAQYVARLIKAGSIVMTFRSTGAAADEGLVNTASAASGVLRFTASETQHAAVQPGVYRIHLFRDAVNDLWQAHGNAMVGAPGEPETYFDFMTSSTGPVSTRKA